MPSRIARIELEAVMSATPQLDEAMQEIVAAMPGMTAAQIDAADLAELIQGFRKAPATSPEIPEVSERDISIPTRHGTVRTRLYRPASPGPLPVLVNLHGGGWLGGTIEQDHARCRFLAERTPCAVVSVDYALAPEHPFPVALEQADDVVLWLAADGATLGGVPGRIALCGSSSGGAIAAALAQRLARRGDTAPAALVLTYPVCDSSGDYGSWRAFASGHLLTADMMRWFWRLYAPREAQRLNGEAAPMRAARLNGSMPTLVVTAECDILRDEAEAYAARLRAEGGSATFTRYPGMIHGFISVAPNHPASIAALEECARFLREAFDDHAAGSP